MQTTTTHLARHITTRLIRPFADVHVRRALAIALLPLILALVGALSSARSAPHATEATPLPIIILASPTAAAPTNGPETTAYQPPRAILARWDYQDETRTAAITSADVARVVGQASDWRLIETTGGARIWVALADVPAGTPADSPLADLTPPTPAPAPQVIDVPIPAAPAPAVEPTAAPMAVPAVEPTAQTHFEMPDTRQQPQTQAAPTTSTTECFATRGGGMCRIAPQQMR